MHRKPVSSWIAAPLLVVGLAAPALADITWADAGTFIVPTQLTPSDNNQSTGNMGVDNDANAAAYTDNSGSGTITVYFAAHFASVVANDVDAPIFLYVNNVSPDGNVTLTSVRWQTGNFITSNAGDHFATLGGFAPIVVTDDTTFFMPGSRDSTNFVQNVGGDTFANQQYDTVLFTFTFTASGGGHSFSIDAVSNPEPGTMALFGLGALGLGGLAWRRRARRLAVANA